MEVEYKFLYGNQNNKSKDELTDIINGQLLFTLDTKHIFLDANNTRIELYKDDIDKINNNLNTLMDFVGDLGNILSEDEFIDLATLLQRLVNTTGLTTENKTIIERIEILEQAISEGIDYTVDIIDSPTTDNSFKTYSIIQNNNTKGKIEIPQLILNKQDNFYSINYGGVELETKIDIPKDLVVKSGSIEVDPDFDKEGTYLVLILNDPLEDKIYIPVNELSNIYEPENSGRNVIITINNSKISASIKQEGITSNELADDAVTQNKIMIGAVHSTELAENAVTNEKIKDGVITYEKLTEELKEKIGIPLTIDELEVLLT